VMPSNPAIPVGDFSSAGTGGADAVIQVSAKSQTKGGSTPPDWEGAIDPASGTIGWLAEVASHCMVGLVNWQGLCQSPRETRGRSRSAAGSSRVVLPLEQSIQPRGMPFRPRDSVCRVFHELVFEGIAAARAEVTGLAGVEKRLMS
jgi:hypothetical protein